MQPLLVTEPFGPAAVADLATIPNDDVAPSWYAGEVAAGRAWMWGVYDGGRRVGTAILREEDHPALGREWVIVAAAGRGDDLFGRVLPLIEAKARAAGAGSVRFHTQRPGLVARAKRAGYGGVEIVMRKAL